MSYGIPDDHIISCIERTGFPPWMQDDDPYEDEKDYEEEEDQE